MKSLLLMFSFFTRIPIRYKYEYKDEDLKRGILWFPVIGLFIGILIFIPSYFLKSHNPLFYSAISWVFYIWISGALHIDGLSDTFDGFFSNSNRERILEIMKDSRIGTFGALGILTILLLDIIGTINIPPAFLLIMPVAGRTAAIVACSVSKYARSTPGMGASFVEGSKMRHSILAVLFFLSLAAAFTGLTGTVAALAVLVTALLTAKWAKSKIGGMTGDTIGFVIEFSQMVFIVAANIILDIT